jgi:hypothetical protein
MEKTKEEKTKFNFLLPKELDKQWRAYVANKWGGYHKGAFSKEVELAIRRSMEEEGNKE